MANNQNRTFREKYLTRANLAILISVGALVVSMLSFFNERQSHKYEKDRDMMIYTPSINDSADSLYIYFDLNNNAIMQYCRLQLPKEICSEPIEVMNRQLRIHRSNIEEPTKRFITKQIEANDSTSKVFSVMIPCIIDFSAVIHGFPQQLREYRELAFIGCVESDMTSISFERSMLVGKCTFPLKKPTGICSFFRSYTDEELIEMDGKYVDEFLDSRLDIVKNSLK